MTPRPPPAEALVLCWSDAGPRRWFARDPGFDAALRERFGALQAAAVDGGFEGWEDTARGALALVLLLDQLPRNLHRGSARAFETDARARAAARRALARGFDEEVGPDLAVFFYMPFEHAEDAADQARSVVLFEAHAARCGDPRQHLRYARLHAALIARFGRFPHRNAVLGRESTPQERAYLEGGGFKS